MSVLGSTFTSAQLLARLGSLERFYSAVQGARDAAERAEWLAAYCGAVRRTKAFIRDLEAALKAKFGVNNPKLRAFGISTARGKQGRRVALRRAFTRQARAQAKNAPRPRARTLAEAVQLVSKAPAAELYLPWITPSNPKPRSED